MNTCGLEKTPVSAAQEMAAFRNVSQIVGDLQKTGDLPAATVVSVVPGMSAAINYTAKTAKLMTDPAVLACVPLLQRKAVMLHESGHWKNPRSSEMTDVMSSALLAALGGIVAMRLSHNIQALIDQAKGRPVWQPPRMFQKPWGKNAFIAWSLFGLYNAAQVQIYEKRADLYAAQRMGDGRPLAAALINLNNADRDMISSLPVDPKENLSDSLGRDFVSYGLLGIFHTHPDTDRRVAYLRAYRPTIVKRAAGPAFASKPH